MSDGTGEAVTFCERNVLFPCLAKNPNPARFLVRYSDCDCEPDAEDTVVAYCWPCLNWMRSLPMIRCDCGIAYYPGWRVFDQIIDLGRSERAHPH